MMNQLRFHRATLGISQSKLARMSGVSRFKICVFELGSGSLTPDEQRQIDEALQAEAERLRYAAARIADESPARPREGR
jgi:predicted transcriptional regulator